jgi:RNA ligase (TIGR02306 family)
MSKWEVKVKKIASVEAHPNADKLEVARVDGFDWDIIVGKNQFKVGDLVVYVPIESILPQQILDTVFKDSKVQPSKGRIKAIKIRQKVSYGLLLTPEPDMKYDEDVAERLKIIKYEPPEDTFSTRTQSVSKKKKNPYFKEYTDIENIKHYPTTFGYKETRTRQENGVIINESIDAPDVVITEKIHGTNFRFGKLKKDSNSWFQRVWNRFTGDYEFVVGSRHVQQKFGSGKTWHEQKGVVSENVYTAIAKRLKAKDWCPENYIVFGEIYGKGIQDLTYGLNDYEFVCFDVMYNDGVTEARYLDYDEVVSFCTQYGIPMVPLLYRGSWNQDCLKFCEGLTTVGNNTTQIREGCVIKTAKETKNSLLGRVILKIINPEYLVRDKGTEFH